MEKEMVVKRYGAVQKLATEVVAFLKTKDVTYEDAIKALEDASSFLKIASLQTKF